MNKIFKKTVMLVMVVCLFLSISVISVNADCSGWTTYATLSSFCDNTDGCGLLWLKDTEKHKEYQERYCNVDGVQIRETRTIYVVDGCC